MFGVRGFGFVDFYGGSVFLFGEVEVGFVLFEMLVLFFWVVFMGWWWCVGMKDVWMSVGYRWGVVVFGIVLCVDNGEFFGFFGGEGMVRSVVVWEVGSWLVDRWDGRGVVVWVF